MNRIDLQTELESIQQRLRSVTTDDELRRLNARKRIIETKMRKVIKRDERTREPGRKVEPRR